MATVDGTYVRRFSATERALHWVNAAGFFTLLGTGLALYIPPLAVAIGRREMVKELHVLAAIAWIAGLATVWALGDRRSLRQTRRELEHLGLEDVRSLAGRPGPQGRFNAGQKVHATVQAAFRCSVRVLGSVALARGTQHGSALRRHDRPAGRADVHPPACW